MPKVRTARSRCRSAFTLRARSTPSDTARVVFASNFGGLRGYSGHLVSATGRDTLRAKVLKASELTRSLVQVMSYSW